MEKTSLVTPFRVIFAICVFALMVSGQLFADPVACTTASMSTYDAAGFSCTNGGDVFSNFTYTATSSGGATAIPDTGVNVIPVDSATLGPGFTFQAAWAAGTGQTTDSMIDFVVMTTAPATVSDASIVQTSSGILGSGAVDVTEGLCLGSTSGAPCPGGMTSILSSNSASTTQLMSQVLFTPTGELTASKDISLVGGTDGTASASGITDQFSTVPEPASLSLFGIGLLGLAFMFRRQLKATA